MKRKDHRKKSSVKDKKSKGGEVTQKTMIMKKIFKYMRNKR